MRRLGLVLLAIIFVCSFSACTAQNGAAAGAVDVTPTAEIAAVRDDPLAAIKSAATVEEVVPYHKAALEAGDYETAIACAERMLELEPGSQDALNALTEANYLRLQADADALNAAIGRGVSEAEDTAAYAEFAARLLEGLDVSFDVPFVSDYGAAENVNTSGITFSNLVQGGLLTAQADWIYISVPNEGWAIYKLREGSGRMTRLGEACGSYLNVVGDWLYYCNVNDANRIYKMRTDGSENQKVCEDTGRFLAVIEDWMYYTVESEDFNLYRARLDGSERTMLSGDPTREAYCSDGALYTALRDKNGLYRANPDASNPSIISMDRAYEYCEYDGWVYILTDRSGIVIDRFLPDGTNPQEMLRFEGKGGVFAVANGKLIVDGSLNGDEPETIYVFDLATMQQGVSLPVWVTALYTSNSDILYFINGVDGAWYWLNMTTGETGALN